MSDLDATPPRPGAFADFPASSEISTALGEIVALSSDYERRVADALEVGPTDLAAMQHLMRSGPLSPSEIARRLGISTAASTMLVDRLQGVGHAHREPHPDDRRRIVIVPNADSVRRAADELRPLLNGVAEVTADLDDDEAEIVGRFLTRVVGVYREVLAPEKPSGSTPGD
jgi:DNA-binding MarR family transcriptional regulator